MFVLDDTNLELLLLLHRDARVAPATLAKALGQSEAAVRQRIFALEERRLLLGYEAKLDWDQVGLPSVAVIRARCDLARAGDAARQLAAIPNVTRAMLVSGPKPILALLRVRDAEHLQALLAQHLSGGELTDIETHIMVRPLVDGLSPLVSPAAADSPPAPLPILASEFF
jgi:Lrp/AsnC family leucine-responsive transcriptional regulator